MKFIPEALLKNLYTRGSLQNEPEGFSFKIKNRLASAQLVALLELEVNGTPIPFENVSAEINGQQSIAALDLNNGSKIDFGLGKAFKVQVQFDRLNEGQHTLKINFKTTPFGKLKFTVKDQVLENGQSEEAISKIPRSEEDDHSQQAVEERKKFAAAFSGFDFDHANFDQENPEVYKNNVENLVGLAKIPLGIAGPIQINGTHAKGEFLIPMATTEGSLIASYNRGMKLINLCGGVTCIVVEDRMQRAPVFVFKSATQTVDFAKWVEAHHNQIKAVAEESSSIAKLTEIEKYITNKFVFLRFNYSTGDAAGQNMVSKATFEACNWILDQYKSGIENFYLESNMATDKKPSFINSLMTRGKRVTAEIVFKRELLIREMGVEPEQVQNHSSVANIGAMMSGTNNNGLHSTNALAALFIALGQDVANLAESSAGFMYSQITPEGDLYGSITLPSLIIATHGGGTGLPTQRECLQLMDCYGPSKALKLAEIIAGVVAAGEISLAAGISSLDWVSAHEQLGRNRNT
ncbi:MAG: hydroxymethylglutaryl-CoA reductase [Bacteroidota bacterium]